MKLVARLPICVLAMLGVEKLLNWRLDTVWHFTAAVAIVVIAGAPWVVLNENGD
jgi:hypothetical protein